MTLHACAPEKGVDEIKKYWFSSEINTFKRTKQNWVGIKFIYYEVRVYMKHANLQQCSACDWRDGFVQRSKRLVIGVKSVPHILQLGIPLLPMSLRGKRIIPVDVTSRWQYCSTNKGKHRQVIASISQTPQSKISKNLMTNPCVKLGPSTLGCR